MFATATQWGTTAGERQLDFPCDRFLERPDAVLFRAITIDAPAGVIFRWLCQLRVAPYSYDWIDNWGRQSPQQLTPGLDRLEIGQDVMTIFTLVDFRRDEHLTMQIKRGGGAFDIFGDIAGTFSSSRERRAHARWLSNCSPVIHVDHWGA